MRAFFVIMLVFLNIAYATKDEIVDCMLKRKAFQAILLDVEKMAEQASSGTKTQEQAKYWEKALPIVKSKNFARYYAESTVDAYTIGLNEQEIEIYTKYMKNLHLPEIEDAVRTIVKNNKTYSDKELVELLKQNLSSEDYALLMEMYNDKTMRKVSMNTYTNSSYSNRVRIFTLALIKGGFNN